MQFKIYGHKETDYGGIAIWAPSKESVEKFIEWIGGNPSKWIIYENIRDDFDFEIDESGKPVGEESVVVVSGGVATVVSDTPTVIIDLDNHEGI